MEEGVCNKCMAGKIVVFGILVLVWNFYINGVWFGKDWPTFIGILLVLKGLAKFVKPTCPHCEVKPAKTEKKK